MPESITDNELVDASEGTQFSLAQIDTKLLTSPTVLRSIGGIVAGLALLVWPDRTDRIVGRLIGLTLVWFGVAALGAWSHSRPREWLGLAASIATSVVGVVLVLSPDRSTVFIGRALGLVLLGYAILGAYKRLRAGADTSQLTLYGLVAAVGLVMNLQPTAVIGTVVAIGALCSILVSVLMLVLSLDARTSGVATYSGTFELINHWLQDRPKSVDARQALYDKILYEGPATQTRVIRFFALMGFAAVIASMGVITDSTAVVIGAMLVAPLMTPLMGMAISLVMGWPNRLTRSALIAAGGIGFAIGIGVLMGLIAPAVIDTASNTQILARTSPTTLDLITAVAAGAAGAYGLSRPDVSDSLPGVAIAISLVPPLTVVGISYSQGDWAAGNGALLLFATNMVAILCVGGLTFIATGVTPIARATENQHRVRTALGVTFTAAVLIFGALLLNGAEIARNTLHQTTVETAVEGWLVDHPEYRLVTSRIEGATVNLVIVGPSAGVPPLEPLADQLGKDLDQAITLDVSLVVEERLTASSN